MSHSYSSNRVHVIFSTKERRPCIPDDFQPKLWAYMAGIAHKQGFEAMIIGGIRDHAHALLILPPTMTLAKAVQFLKGSSSKWINETNGDFAWQEGYGAFSVSASQTPDVIRYIANQRTHHEKKSFEDEFLEFLKIWRGLRSVLRIGVVVSSLRDSMPRLSADPALKRWAKLLGPCGTARIAPVPKASAGTPSASGVRA